ncbi:MAG: outer membrane protein assembly factor BamB family protein [Deltaproteobacteria bacterium]
MRGIGLIGVACLAGLACAPPPSGLALVSSQPERRVRRIYRIDWRKQLASMQEEEPPARLGLLRWNPLETAGPLVVSDAQEVVAASGNGKLAAFSFEGKPYWRFDAGGAINVSPVRDGGKLFIASDAGRLFCLEAATGSELWRTQIGESASAPLAVADGTVFVPTEESSLFAFDEATGKRRWHYRRELSGQFSLRTRSAPKVAGNVIYQGFPDGTLVALGTQNGAVLWQRAGSASGQTLDADSGAQEAGGRVYVASYQDGILALDARDGTVKWRRPLNGATGLMLTDGLLFATAVGQLAALAPGDGSIIWQKGFGQRTPRDFTRLGNLLAVPTSDALVFLDDRTGSLLGAPFNPGHGVDAPPAAHGRQLFVTSNEGWLYALELR